MRGGQVPTLRARSALPEMLSWFGDGGTFEKRESMNDDGMNSPCRYGIIRRRRAAVSLLCELDRATMPPPPVLVTVCRRPVTFFCRLFPSPSTTQRHPTQRPCRGKAAEDITPPPVPILSGAVMAPTPHHHPPHCISASRRVQSSVTLSPTATGARPSAHHWTVCDKATLIKDFISTRSMVGHRQHGIPMQGVTERPRESCPVGCVLHCRRRRPQPICSRRALVGLATDCGVRSVGRRSAGHDWTGLARGQKVGERRGGSSAVGMGPSHRPLPGTSTDCHRPCPCPSGTDRTPGHVFFKDSRPRSGWDMVCSRRWSTRRVIIFPVILFADQQLLLASTAAYMNGGVSSRLSLASDIPPPWLPPLSMAAAR